MPKYYAVRIIKPTKNLLQHFEGPFKEWELGAAVNLGELNAQEVKALGELILEDYPIELSQTWPPKNLYRSIVLIPKSTIDALDIKTKAKFNGLLHRFSEGVIHDRLDRTFFMPLDHCISCVRNLKGPPSGRCTSKKQELDRKVSYLVNIDMSITAPVIAWLLEVTRQTVSGTVAWKRHRDKIKHAVSKKAYELRDKGAIEDSFDGMQALRKKRDPNRKPDK